MTDGALHLAMALLCGQGPESSTPCLYLFTNDRTPATTDESSDYTDLDGVAPVELSSWEVAAGINVTLASHPAITIPLPHPCPTIYGWRIEANGVHLGAKRLELPTTPTVAGCSISIEPWLRLERKDV